MLEIDPLHIEHDAHRRVDGMEPIARAAGQLNAVSHRVMALVAVPLEVGDGGPVHGDRLVELVAGHVSGHPLDPQIDAEIVLVVARCRSRNDLRLSVRSTDVEHQSMKPVVGGVANRAQHQAVRAVPERLRRIRERPRRVRVVVVVAVRIVAVRIVVVVVTIVVMVSRVARATHQEGGERD